MYYQMYHSILFRHSKIIDDALFVDFNRDIDQIILIPDDQSNYIIVDCSMHEFLEVHEAEYASQDVITNTFNNVEKKLKGNM